MLPSPPSTPPVEPDLRPVTRARSRWLTRLAPLAVGAVLVAAGGVFGVRALQGDGGDPQDPVDQLFTALDREDMIGVLEALTPAERDILVGRSQRLAGELRRIGVADDTLDLGHLAGVDLQVSDLKLESTRVTDDLAEVRVVAGQLSSSVSVDQLPLGQDLRRLADEGEGRAATDPQTENLADRDVRFMVLRHGGSWGVSLGYTLAEAARRDAGLDRPDFGNSSVHAQGATSPERAVEGLLGAVDDGDLPGVIGHLDPEEMAPLYDYAPLFLPDGARSDELAAQAEQFTISDLELTSEGSGSERVVRIAAATVTVDNDDVHAVVRLEDGCLHAESGPGDGSDPQVVDMCPGQAGATLDSLGSRELSQLGELFDPSALSDAAGIAVHEVDGTWYVSPSRTVLDAAIGLLGAVRDGAVGELIDMVQSGVDGAN